VRLERVRVLATIKRHYSRGVTHSSHVDTTRWEQRGFVLFPLC